MSGSTPTFADIVSHLQECADELGSEVQTCLADLLTEAVELECFDAALLLLAAPPSLAATFDFRGWLPIHTAAGACHERAHECVGVLLALAPQTATAATAYDDGYLPLHIAALHDADARTLQLLLASAPQAAIARDAAGRTPLHRACEEAAAGAVRALLEAAPQATTVPADDGLLPMHYAACNGKVEAVQQLLQSTWAAGRLFTLRRGMGTWTLSAAWSLQRHRWRGSTAMIG